MSRVNGSSGNAPERGLRGTQVKVEAAPGFEPGIRALQARALPLGYAATSCTHTRTNVRASLDFCVHRALELDPQQYSEWVSTGSDHAFGPRAEELPRLLRIVNSQAHHALRLATPGLLG